MPQQPSLKYTKIYCNQSFQSTSLLKINNPNKETFNPLYQPRFIRRQNNSCNSNYRKQLFNNSSYDKQNCLSFLNSSKISEICPLNLQKQQTLLSHTSANNTYNFSQQARIMNLNESTIVNENQQKRQNSTMFQNQCIYPQTTQAKHQILNSLLFSKIQYPQNTNEEQNLLASTSPVKRQQFVNVNSSYKKIFLEYSPAQDQHNLSKDKISQSFITYNNDQNSLLLSGFNQQDMALSAYVSKQNIQEYLKSYSIVQEHDSCNCNFKLNQQYMTTSKKQTSLKKISQYQSQTSQFSDSKRDLQIFASQSHQKFRQGQRQGGQRQEQRQRQFSCIQTINEGQIKTQAETKTQTTQNSKLDNSSLIVFQQCKNQVIIQQQKQKQVKPLSLSFLNYRNNKTACENSTTFFTNQLFGLVIQSDQKIKIKVNNVKNLNNFEKELSAITLLTRLKTYFRTKITKILEFYQVFCTALDKDDFLLFKRFLFINNIPFKNDQFTQMLIALNKCITFCIQNAIMNSRDVKQWQIFESFLFYNFDFNSKQKQNSNIQYLYLQLFFTEYEKQQFIKLKPKKIWDIFRQRQRQSQLMKKIWVQFKKILQQMIQ